MEAGSYVALSGQLVLQERMSILAGNIANANTPGFKAGSIDFRTVLAEVGTGGTAFAANASSTLDMSSGGVSKTGNPLDLAISGSATFAYESPQGTYYSRDGRLTVSADGQLQNLQRHQLLNVSLAPVTVNPNAGPVTVGRDGSIVQEGKSIDQLGLFSVSSAEGYSRRGTAGFVPSVQPEPVASSSQNEILQGFLEGSNVNAISEMVNLIEVSRAFESVSTFADKTLEAERNAIEVLGSR